MSSDSTKEQLAVEVAELLEKCKGLSYRVGVYNAKLTGENDAFAAEYKAILAKQKSLYSKFKQLQSADGTVQIRHQLSDVLSIIHGTGPGGDLRKFVTRRLPWLLSLLAGARAPVVSPAMDASVGIRIREDYHKFRDRLAQIMFGFPVLLKMGFSFGQYYLTKANEEYSVKPFMMTMVQVYLSALVYCYLTLAIRESILAVNGSHIKPWWIEHHGWSTIFCIIMLLLPIDSPKFQSSVQPFLSWSIAQGVVMMVQNQYQRKRMYTRIAIGRNSSMDVVGGESSGMSGQLRLLYPLLMLLQASQFYIGVRQLSSTYKSWTTMDGFLNLENKESDLRGQRGLFLAGVVFTMLAVRNMLATLSTYLEKREWGSLAKKRYTQFLKRQSGVQLDSMDASAHSAKDD